MEKNIKNGQSMSELFKGYSKYSDKEYKDIWKSAIIVVDANILLNFYRFSNETRNEIYEVLKSQKERLWIPYQVGYEYFKNKENVIEDSNNNLKNLSETINKCFSEMNKKVNDQSEKRLKCKDKIKKVLLNQQKEIEEIISDEIKNNKSKEREDDIEQKILELFDNTIGIQIEGDEFEKIKQEGNRRIQQEIPPGYKDKSKEENGDYYIFYSMIEYAKKNKKHMIFITDDVKEDWFIRRFGEIKSGEYRILNEFYKETGKLLLIYTSDGFVKAYQKNIKNSRKVDSKIIDELIENRSERYDKEIYISSNIYRNKIKHIIKRLFNYDSYPKIIILREIENLKEYLDEIDVLDKKLEVMLEILIRAMKRNKSDEINMVLHELDEYIDSNPIYSRKIKKDYKDSDVYVNYTRKDTLLNEKNNIYEKASLVIDKIGKIKDDKRKVIMLKNMLNVLDKVNNKIYLSDIEKIELNNQMDELLNECD